MDTAIEELLRQGLLGTTLTPIDWNILLQDASDSGSLHGVLVASHKLKIKPPKAILENLLLTALCSGECIIALDACKELQRDLIEKEKNILAESTILSGNVQEFFECFTIDDPGTLGMFHTTIAIATGRLLRKNKGLELPTRVNLHSWVKIYHKELSLFNPIARYVLESDTPPAGIFFVFSKETCAKFLGALLVENFITKECARAIQFLNF